MKKIGIITYHFALNYGSVLQCYALQEYLKYNKYDVKIINFVSKTQYINNSFSKGMKGKLRDIVFFPLRLERKKKINKFISFRNQYLCQTDRVTNIAELEKLIRNEKFDIIISGSDQVFNSNINDYNEAFVFPIKTDAIKVAYAASLGDAKDKELEKIKKYLKQFKAISLREEKDRELIERILHNKIDVVCDPVFLLSKNEWEERINKIDFEYNYNEKYLLCYFIHKKYMGKAIRIAKKIAKIKNLNIIFINSGYSIHSFSKKTIVDCGPIDFVKLFLNADYICTDSFHGTSFSIIFNKQFTCFDSIKNNKDNRRSCLLKKLELRDSLQFVENDLQLKHIDNYNRINRIIEEYSEKSKKFLEMNNGKY